MFFISFYYFYFTYNLFSTFVIVCFSLLSFLEISVTGVNIFDGHLMKKPIKDLVVSLGID